MNVFQENRRDLLSRLGTDEINGLSDVQVAINTEKYGSNTLSKEKPESLFKRIWAAAVEPMILMLLMAGAIALAVNVIRGATGGEADYFEVVGIFTAISLSVIITVVMEGRSTKAFEELSKISDDNFVKALRKGEAILLNQNELVVGDIVLLTTGDKIPADGRLLESASLAVDESALTGESLPAKKNADLHIVDEGTPLAERKNMLYSGTYITGGYGKMVITEVGDHTEFGKIARELTHTERTTTPLQEKLSRLGKNITILGVTLVFFFFS